MRPTTAAAAAAAALPHPPPVPVTVIASRPGVKGPTERRREEQRKEESALCVSEKVREYICKVHDRDRERENMWDADFMNQ